MTASGLRWLVKKNHDTRLLLAPRKPLIRVYVFVGPGTKTRFQVWLRAKPLVKI